jgi:protein-S-isoprenylcysteine O-methyltransferase Ste14
MRRLPRHNNYFCEFYPYFSARAVSPAFHRALHSGALALLGAALFYRSLFLLAYGCIFLLAAFLFVLFYEEATLRRSFGADYDAYCHRVTRWLPRMPSS